MRNEENSRKKVEYLPTFIYSKSPQLLPLRAFSGSPLSHIIELFDVLDVLWCGVDCDFPLGVWA